MTRLWIPGQRIKVDPDEWGAPIRFRWQRKQHRVERVISRWRVDEDWWAQHIWREYFKVITKTGLMVIIYRDFVNGSWHFERLYD